MKILFGKKKAEFAAAAAVVIVALSAAAAFAAPVLAPGTTSAPGMSGTCTDCHTYAQPAAKPAPKKVVLLPSHPYVKHAQNKLGKAFGVWGYVPPKLCGTTNATLTVSVSRYTHSKWTAVPSLNQTATLSTSGKFKNKTNYATSLTINRGGSYRMRVKLVYLDSKSVERTKWSAWKKFSIKK